uniref:Uncharacterized protein n=1 Tax=Anguilla anguilla TaxID=7936 RepID=A0A0E9SIL1_ANGAN
MSLIVTGDPTCTRLARCLEEILQLKYCL